MASANVTLEGPTDTMEGCNIPLARSNVTLEGDDGALSREMRRRFAYLRSRGGKKRGARREHAPRSRWKPGKVIPWRRRGEAPQGTAERERVLPASRGLASAGPAPLPFGPRTAAGQ